MHIHGAMSSQLATLIPTQSAQQTTAARRAAAEVRRKLTGSAAACATDAVSCVETYTPGSRQRKDGDPADEKAFRKILASISI
jgi:hypothetical protein